MARHLHEQAGGNPSQGPKGEMANPQPSPGAGNDFPDVPPANVAGGTGDEDEGERDTAAGDGPDTAAGDGDRSTST